MRHLILLPLALVLWVYSVTGDAWKKDSSGEWVAIKRADTLSPSDIIRTGEESSLSILDKKSGALIPVQNKEGVRVESLFKKKNIVSLAKDYVNYMFLALSGKVGDEQQAAGVVYRDHGDGHVLTDIAPVEISLVRSKDNVEVVGTVEERELYYFRVINLSANPLFVNVVCIDENGVAEEAIPLRSKEQALEILIPPGATVSLSSLPVMFSPVGSHNLLIPVASRTPFLLSDVLSRATRADIGALRIPGRHQISVLVIPSK